MTSMVNTIVMEVGFSDKKVFRNFFIIQAPGDLKMNEWDRR